MQKVYSVHLLLAAMLSLASVVAITPVLRSTNPPEGGKVALLAGSLIPIFIVFNLVLRGVSKEPLCMPVSQRVHGMITLGVVILALAWFGVGIVRWSAAPIRQEGDTFRDKTGHARTSSEYAAFRKWEATLPLACLPFALVAITALPATASDKRMRSC